MSKVVVASTDGRRLRSDRSRRQIVHAMLALIRAGDMAPSAAHVAAAAGVGLRTVFRHFEELDSLYREMSAIVEAEVQPLRSRPVGGRTWRHRLDELLDRRVAIYERIMPAKVAGELRRFASPYLMEDFHRFLRVEHDGLVAVLPRRIATQKTLLAALELTTGFHAWRRLRQDQRLPPARAREVLKFSVERLLAAVK